MPEAEVVELKLENSILTISVGDDEDAPKIIEGDGDTSELG